MNTKKDSINSFFQTIADHKTGDDNVSFSFSFNGVTLKLLTDGESVTILKLSVPKKDRRQGRATLALEWLTASADKHQITLDVISAPDHESIIKPKDLVSFYKAHKFESVAPDSIELMRRHPQRAKLVSKP